MRKQICVVAIVAFLLLSMVTPFLLSSSTEVPMAQEIETNGRNVVSQIESNYDYTELPSYTQYNEFPQIDAGQVVWQGRDESDAEIYLYDGVTTHQLTDNEFYDFNPQIDAGQVVWEGYDGSDYEIYLYDGVTTHQLTDNDVDDYDPQIDAGQVVWYGWDDGEADFEVFFLPSLYSEIQIISEWMEGDWFHDINPNIHNGLITWDKWDGGYYHSIWVSDGSASFEIWRNYDPPDPETEYHPQIHDGIVTFVSDIWYGSNPIDDGLWIYEVTEFYDPGGWMPYRLANRLGFPEEIGATGLAQIDSGLIVLSAFVQSVGQNIFLYGPDTFAPRINQPEDVELMAGLQNQYIEWTPFDNNPDYYTVTRDNEVVLSEGWTGESIWVEIETQQSGFYSYECTVYDTFGNSASDMVQVEVLSQAPIWTLAPSDQIIYYGQQFDYQIAAIDMLGVSEMGIDQWWINDLDNFELSATFYGAGSTARIRSISTLSPGIYNLEVGVIDLEGYSVAEIFQVVVIEGGAPIYPTQTGDPIFTLHVLAAEESALSIQRAEWFAENLRDIGIECVVHPLPYQIWFRSVLYPEDYGFPRPSSSGAPEWTTVTRTPHFVHVGGGEGYMWCGANDGDPPYDLWGEEATPPGYGNNWNDVLEKQLTLPGSSSVGSISLSYSIQYDTEPNYDFVYVEISTDGIDWNVLASFDGTSNGFEDYSHEISEYSGQNVYIRFHFISDAGVSDEDGFDTDGACRIDWVEIVAYNADPPNLPLWQTRDDFLTSTQGWLAYSPELPAIEGFDIAFLGINPGGYIPGFEYALPKSILNQGYNNPEYEELINRLSELNIDWNANFPEPPDLSEEALDILGQLQEIWAEDNPFWVLWGRDNWETGAATAGWSIALSNTNNEHLANEVVRQAISLAIDRQGMIDAG
ncbi:MAG: hypothetical protein ACFFCX_17405, partial [Candidatus Sifarchaeia archaeon]